MVATAYRTIGKRPSGTVHGFENKLKLVGDGEGLDGFHMPLRDAVASYVSGKYKWEIDFEWLKERLRETIHKAPKKQDREKDIPFYTSDDYFENNIISSAIEKYCQETTHPKYPTPTLTPKQARLEITSIMWTIADQHFEALADWEKVNKHYQDRYQSTYEEWENHAKETARKNGDEYDANAEAAAIHRHVLCVLEFSGIPRPGRMPKAVLNLAVGVGLGKTEQAFKLIKYVRDKALALLKADKSADDVSKLTDDTRIAYKITSDGFYTWTNEDMDAYEEQHPSGSKARLAYALLYYTASRRGDVVRLGRQHIKNGRLVFTQNKTHADMDLPVHPELWTEINAIDHDQLTFLITGYGNPFTPEGFGNWFKDRCVEAGLKRCTAHGLRKAATKTVIEQGKTTAQAGGLTGHKTLAEIDHYSAKRDRAALSDVAVSALTRIKK